MKKFIMIIFCTLLVFFSANAETLSGNENTKYEYDSLTHYEKETMSFSYWWTYFKQYARENGVWVEDSDRDYFYYEYYEEGYYPDEAFDEEY